MMRCAKCNKKLGLIEYKCKCEKLFCISHLHAEEHNCNYDYKEEARLLLEKRNIVKDLHQKMEKI